MNTQDKLAIYDWVNENKLKKAQRIALLESWRRSFTFHEGDLNANLLLLALPSEVKTSKEFLKPSDGEMRGFHNWYNLTEAGKLLLKQLNEKVVWKKEFNQELFEA
tara:strand:- start:654 stop:971 length:318 start_codon:yes stop_codon:yes gene_type:complete